MSYSNHVGRISAKTATAEYGYTTKNLKKVNNPGMFCYTVPMSTKTLVWIGTIVGSTIGGMIPELWGAGFLSLSSLFLSSLGAAAGIIIGFKLGND